MDIDGDGYLDILSGSYSRMEVFMAGLIFVLRGKPDGTFHPAEVLNGTDGEPLIIPVANEEQEVERICTRPFAVDWDGDGYLDLVVGNFSGTFYWFKGQGKGKFAPKPEQIMTGGEPLRIAGAHSDPFVVDWDGDGDLDIISGSTDGGVQWAENVAGKGQPPEMRPFRTLIPPTNINRKDDRLSEEQLTGPTFSTRVWVADVNGNGKLDLLVGDSVSLVSFAPGLSKEDYVQRQREWSAELTTILKKMDAEKDENEQVKLNQQLAKHYQKRSDFIKEDRTGYVWVYYRK